MISFEQIQIWLIDITSMFQLFGAILGLCALLIPILRTLPFYYTLLYWYDMCMTMIIHTFSRLGKYIPYFGSSRYIDDLQYQEDPLHICLSSFSYKDQQQQQQQSQKVLIDDDGDDILVSGLINTGNTCFLNSVLQALSSLPGLYEFIYQMKDQQHELPITWTLFKTLRRLTKPQRSRTSIRPLELVRALANKNKSSSTSSSTYTSKRRLSSFLMDRDQQDAQEFFQVLIGAMDTEAQYFYQEKWKSSHEKKKETDETDQENGLRGILLLMDQENNNNNNEKNAYPSSTTTMKNKQKRQQQQYSYNSPMTGLLASRLSCVQCGYTGAIRHFPFNNIQLSLPNAYSVTIEQCLEQYTTMEYLRDASCKRCSYNMTSQLLDDKIKRLQQQAKHALKKDLKKKLLTELVEDSINERKNTTLKNRKSIQRKKYYYRTISPRSTKQVMIAKPPPILCLHMTRSSINYSSGMIFKNTCQLLFNEYLNLSPYVTNGILNTHPTVPLSGFTEGNNKLQNNIKYLYRLMSIVVHYGSHSYGHYIAYKR
ncbi:hypothetical protein BJ944DRAFT_199370, partial [Cunninghamella echinulata]